MIRALTIRSPWSDCIALDNGKRTENRVWRTNWRGTLLIHAGQAIDRVALTLPLVTQTLPAGHQLVKGAVVAVADLADIHMDDGPCTPWSLRDHYHWQLTNLRALPEPIPATGAQGLWHPKPGLLEQIAATAPNLAERLSLT